jgi:hypothetical protein
MADGVLLSRLQALLHWVTELDWQQQGEGEWAKNAQWGGHPSAAHSTTSPQTTFCTLYQPFLHTRLKAEVLKSGAPKLPGHTGSKFPCHSPPPPSWCATTLCAAKQLQVLLHQVTEVAQPDFVATFTGIAGLGAAHMFGGDITDETAND